MPPGVPATLIYNAGAGSAYRASAEELQAELRRAGYDVQVQVTTSVDVLPGLLAPLSGPVFVAGGDGTIRTAALHLLGRPETHLGVLPLGTANNVARALGLYGDPLEVAGWYARAGVHPFDVGRVRAPWGQDIFLEAFGCGLFADVLHAYNPHGPKSPLRAMRALLDTLPAFEPQELDVTVDGRPAPFPPLALLQIMNTPSTGNGLHLAPDADPGDGQFELIRVNGLERDSLLAYAGAMLRGDFDLLPSVHTLTGRRFTVPDDGQVFHLDTETRNSFFPGGVVEVEVWEGALRVLRPEG